jgi:hypothetical protein
MGQYPSPRRRRRPPGAKLRAQLIYVIWRDGVATDAVRPAGKGSKGGKISDLKSYLPDTDPGAVVIHRWRKRLLDEADFAKACADAAERCRRICEQESATTAVRGTEGTGEFERYTPPEYIDAAGQPGGT